MGHPILRKVAKEVSLNQLRSTEFQQFIDSMVETMREYDGVGLAAPQVHQSVRVCVIEFEESNPRYKIPQAQGLQFYINPKIKPLTEETYATWEGCLSVPGMRGLVARPKKIHVEYLDRLGKRHEFEAEGFLAVVLQHEFDHLDGKLYIDRLVDPSKFAYDQEFERYILPDSKEDLQ